MSVSVNVQYRQAMPVHASTVSPRLTETLGEWRTQAQLDPVLAPYATLFRVALELKMKGVSGGIS